MSIRHLARGRLCFIIGKRWEKTCMYKYLYTGPVTAGHPRVLRRYPLEHIWMDLGARKEEWGGRRQEPLDWLFLAWRTTNRQYYLLGGRLGGLEQEALKSLIPHSIYSWPKFEGLESMVLTTNCVSVHDPRSLWCSALGSGRCSDPFIDIWAHC